MFCPKCGAACADDAKFCKSCGAPMPASSVVPATANASQTVPASAVSPAPTAAVATKQRRSKTPIAIAVGIAALAAILALIFIVVKPFGDSVSSDNMANNASFGYGYAVEVDGWDYFYSDVKQGLCRAKSDGTVEMVYSVPADKGYTEWGINHMATLNGRIFFVKTSYTGESPNQVCSIKPDGSDEKIIYSGSESSNSISGSPVAIYVYDCTLYVFVYDYENKSRAYRLLTMEEDGSNQQQLCSITDDVSSYTITPDEIIYSKSDYVSGQQTLSEIYSQNLDGSDFEQIYKSSVGSIYNMAVSDGRLVFREENYSAEKAVFTSIAMDGSDAKTLFEASGDDSNCYALGVADGYLYLNADAYNGDNYDADAVIVRLPLSGGDMEALPSVGTQLYNPCICVLNGHLLLLDNGTGAGGAGTCVMALDYEGNKLADYVSRS